MPRKGFSPKNVVHSRHPIVMRRHRIATPPFMTLLFHGQALDFIEISGFGVFLANLTIELAGSLEKRGASV
jgi:hypothetical protein